MTRRRQFGPLVASALVVLVLDQITKVWAVEGLGSDIIDLFWTLRFRLIRNTGSAFGLGGGLGRWLGLLVIIIVIAAIWWARNVTDRRVLVLLGLVLGGAIGNLIDRVLRADDGWLSGGVIDFIDLQWWPVFNVADMGVVCGAIGLMVLTWRADVEAARAAAGAADESVGNDEVPKPDEQSHDSTTSPGGGGLVAELGADNADAP